MRVCLVQPPPASAFDKHWARFPVLGLAYVAAALRQAGHEIVLLDGKLDNLTVEEVCRRAVACNPGLLGITCMTVEFPQVVRIACGIREHSSMPIILGGAHVNAVGADALLECPLIDFACVGEGEFLVTELADALDGAKPFEAVAGLIFRRGNELVRNPQRPYPEDYNKLAFPAWDLFSLRNHIPVLTHRGCPYRCTFCGHNSGFKARFRSTENVLEEIADSIARYRPAVIRFEDETFGLDMRRTKSILLGILERGLHHFVRFSAQTRVDRIDQEFVELMKNANFETLEIGVESGNPQI